MDTKTIYRRNIFKEGEYPHNLLSAISDLSESELPAELTPDMQDGIRYALSLLPKISQEVIDQRYQQKKPRTEIARELSLTPEKVKQIEDTALRSFLRPTNWNCVEYGLEAYRKILIEKQGTLKSKPIVEFSIGRLGLTTSAYNALKSAGYNLIADVAALSDSEIMSIRKLGPKSRSEIAVALQDNGVMGTEWDKYC